MLPRSLREARGALGAVGGETGFRLGVLQCRAGGSALWGPRRGLGERVEVALAVARGMAALEGARPPLLHRDLKPSNVFMGALPASSPPSNVCGPTLVSLVSPVSALE